MMASPAETELEHYRANCVAAVSDVLAEPVIDAAPFNRRGLYTNKLLGKFGFVPYLIGRAHAKSQAGGLPEQFVLAVSPTKVRAFTYKAHGRRRDRYEVGEELAAWDRGAVSVSWENGPPYQTDVTITPKDGEQILCRCGRTSWSESFLRLMAEPGATA
jgi:hypothetical protein